LPETITYLLAYILSTYSIV